MINKNNNPEIIFWGVRGSIATPGEKTNGYGGNTTCLQVILPATDELLIFDCGTGVVNLGNSLSESECPLNGKIFITHTHWDHIQAIPFFKPFYSPGNHFELSMPEQLGKSCMEVVKMIMAPVFFPVNIEAFQAEIDYKTECCVPIAYEEGYIVESLRVSHPGNTVMYKITSNDKSIVFCPDNEYLLASEEHKKNMLAFVKNADVLIHDSHYSRETYTDKKGWGHTAWEDTVELGIEAGVKHLFLTHHAPEASDVILDERATKLDPYRHHFKSVRFARENEHFVVD